MLHAITFPVVLGQGKRLFDGAASPRATALEGAVVTPKGVVIATYRLGGEPPRGSFALPDA